MQVLQRIFCVILISPSVLARVSSILLKQPRNATVTDEFRHPTFTKNLLNGLQRVETISGSSNVPIVEVRNSVAPGVQSSTNLDQFRAISIDVIITRGRSVPYSNQRVTLFGSASTWGSWGTSLVDLQDVDAATARRAFTVDQIVMDEEEAYDVLRKAGFNGPWAFIYLCKLTATDSLFYVFQQPSRGGSFEKIYQFVGVADGRVRLFHGAVQYPCTQLSLDLTMNVTFQAKPTNRTNLQVSPSGMTNGTLRKTIEVDGALPENITTS